MSYRPVSKALLNVLPWTLLACVFLASCGSGSTTDQGSATATGGMMAAPSITPPPVITATQITAFAASGSNTKVTSPNALSTGDVVVITGTTNYNGTFSVVSATASDFIINTAFVANDGNGYWQPGGGVIAGCSATGDTSFISPVGLPSRVSGVAPLAVFFNASSTAATTTARPFHELSYQWNFADPGSGNWAYGSGMGSNSKNTAYGPMAAHVFDNAGTYLINLTVSDGTHTVTNQCLRIAVQDPPVVYAGTKTTCISASSMPSAGFDGCPSGAAVAQQSNVSTIINSYCGNGKRVLLRHDDTFTGSTGTIGSGCQVDMYGSGAKPILSGASLQIGTGSAAISDARILNVDVESPPSHGMNIYAYPHGSVTDVLVYNSTFRNCNGLGANAVQASVFQDQVARRMMLVGNTFDHCGHMDANNAGGEGIYMMGQDTVLMGNNIIGNGNLQQHLVRFQYADRAVISNNSLSNGPSNKEMIAVRSVQQPTDGGAPYCTNCYTNHVVVSDNALTMTAGYVGIRPGPTNSSSTSEVIDNVILERNWYWAPAGSNVVAAMEIHSTNTTIRNEVINETNAPFYEAIQIDSSYLPYANNVWIYDNTAYSANSGTGHAMVHVASNSSNVAVANNLAYYPNYTSPSLLNDSGIGTVSSNNSTNAQVKGTSPNWANSSGTFSTPSDFRLNAGSYAIGAGTGAPVWADFFQAAEPSPRDIGAANH